MSTPSLASLKNRQDLVNLDLEVYYANVQCGLIVNEILRERYKSGYKSTNILTIKRLLMITLYTLEFICKAISVSITISHGSDYFTNLHMLIFL